MNYDISSPFDWPAQVGGGERVVHNQWQSSGMGDFGDGSDIRNDATRIGETLDEYGLAFGREAAPEVLWVGGVDEMAVPAQLLERKTKLGQRAAVELARG